MKKGRSKKPGPPRRPKRRGVWLINPKTRVKKSKKRYERLKRRKEARHIAKQIELFDE